MIQEMTAQTVQQVHEIFSKEIPECWSLSALEEELTNPNARVLTVMDGQRVVGFVQLRLIAGEGELLNIAVAKQAQRHGVGRKLIQAIQTLAVQENIDCYFLEVRSKNQKAIAFYEQLGFCQIGKRARFYQHPIDDALLYQWKNKIE